MIYIYINGNPSKQIVVPYYDWMRIYDVKKHLYLNIIHARENRYHFYPFSIKEEEECVEYSDGKMINDLEQFSLTIDPLVEHSRYILNVIYHSSTDRFTLYYGIIYINGEEGHEKLQNLTKDDVQRRFDRDEATDTMRREWNLKTYFCTG